MESQPYKARSFRITELLKPQAKALLVGLFAAIGEAVASLLQPWPLKIVLDSVLKSRRSIHGWLNRLFFSAAGHDKIAILKIAVLAVIIIALLDAVCSYVEKY